MVSLVVPICIKHIHAMLASRHAWQIVRAMRLLAVLVLGFLPATSHAFNATNYATNYLFPAHALPLANPSHESLSWASMVACKAELVRLQQKSILHAVRYNAKDIQAAHVALKWGLTVISMVSFIAFLLEKRKRAVQHRLASLREQELLDRCSGVQAEAFDLGQRAAAYALQLSHVQAELARARTERDDARRQNQHLILKRQQVAKADSYCQADMLLYNEPPQLASECSTPELEQLVAGAAANDTAHSSVDQSSPAKNTAMKGPIGSAIEEQDDLVGLSKQIAKSPVTSVVELLNTKAAEEGRHYRVVEDSSSAFGSQTEAYRLCSKAEATPQSQATQPTVTPTAYTTTVSAAQPVQLQLQIVGSSAGSLIHDQVHAVVSQRDNERLKEENHQLAAENKLLSAEKRQLEAQVGQMHSIYVTTSRGGRTPVAFGSPLGASKAAFSPYPWAAQHSPGSGSATAGDHDASNTATSSCYRPGMPASTVSPPGSAGSNRLSTPVQAAVSGSPYTAGSSAASVIGAKPGKQVQPLPMRPLESLVSTPRSSCLTGSPAHQNLKATAEQAAKMVAQRREESEKQRQDAGRTRS